MRKMLIAIVTPLALAAVAGQASAAGVSGPAFYVDGQLYRTVGTPTNLSATGAPASSFDTIYQFSGAQSFNVAAAAPGDTDYNGGRWRVEVIAYAPGESYASALATFDANGSDDFDSDGEVLAAISAGALTTSDGPSFVCPVIHLPHQG
jgi:hypothetical protein